MSWLQSSPFYLERVGLEVVVNLRLNLKNGENLIGRKLNNPVNVDFAVDSRTCSGKHCLITVRSDSVFVQSLNKKNGTFINGVKMDTEVTVKLRELDIIGIVGGLFTEKDLLGRYEFFVYRLRKYDSDNLLTIQIDDDDEVVLSDDDDGNEVICLDSDDDESVNSKEEHDLEIQISTTFNEEIKKELLDFEEIEALGGIKKESYDFYELEIDEALNAMGACSFDPHETSEDVRNGSVSDVVDTNSNDSTETVQFSTTAQEREQLIADLMDDDVIELMETPPEDETNNNSNMSHKDPTEPSILVEEIKESKRSPEPTPSTSDADKLKQTVTKLNDQMKRKKGPEIIEAKPLEKRCRTKIEDNHVNGKLKPETSPVTKEHIKDKLKSIAIAKPKDSTDEKQKVQTTVKAKVTKENRGSFLTDPTQMPGLPGAKAGKKVISSPPHHFNGSKNTAIKSSPAQNGKTSPKYNAVPSCSGVDPRSFSSRTFEAIASTSSVDIRSPTYQNTMEVDSPKAEPSRRPSQIENGKTSPKYNAVPSCSGVDPRSFSSRTYEAIPSSSKVDLRSPKHQSSMEVQSPNGEHSRRSSNEGKKGNAFQDHPRHDIISKLTSYDADKHKTVDAFCSSFGTDVEAVADIYQDYLEYRRTLVSLMMVELWKEIELAYPKSEIFTTVSVYDINLEKRGNGERMIFHCQGDSLYKSQSVSDGSLVYVKTEHNGKKIDFLALITEFKYLSKAGDQKLAHFTMESSVLTEVLPIKSVEIRPITVVTNTLNALSSIYSVENSPLRNLILNPLSSQHTSQLRTENVVYKGYDPLDDHQKSILKSIYKRCTKLNVPNISLLDGAAGTGKSRVIHNLALQLVYGDNLPKPLRILICSRSNKNIDDIVMKLIHIRDKTAVHHKIRLVRFGLLEHMDSAVRSVSVQSIKDSDSRFLEFANIEKLKTEKETLQLKIRALGFLKENDHKAELKLWKSKLLKVNTLIGRLEVLDKTKLRDATTVILNSCDIICTTLGSIAKLQNYVSNVDICIINEATQCNEVITLLPFRFGMPSLVLVGDSQLVPHTSISPIVNQKNYSRSLFARYQNLFSGKANSPVFEIYKQHRMHPEILNWPNNHFYGGRLLATPPDDKFPIVPYKIISYNSPTVNECDNIMLIIDMLLDCLDRNMYTIGVVCTHPEQNFDMRNRLRDHPYITSNTADSYLPERDVVIVWVGKRDGIFHLVNHKILNMALTRAKKCLLICGADLASYKNRPFWKSLLGNAQQRNCLQSFKTIGPRLINTLRKRV